LTLGPGDEVLASNHEYSALDRTWQFVCEASGASYVRAPIEVPVRPSADVVEALWDAVTSRTRILFVSHVTSPTGIIFPIAELASRARDSGIVTVVDGAHAPGQIPIDLGKLGVDVYSGNCRKWMIAPKGAAFLHVRAEVQPLVEPLVVSWGWRSKRPGPSRFVDQHEWQGSRDVSAFLSVPSAGSSNHDHSKPRSRNARCISLSTPRFRGKQ